MTGTLLADLKWALRQIARSPGFALAVIGMLAVGIAAVGVIENIRWSVVGIGLGAVGAWGVGRALRGLLYGVTPAHPVTLVGAGLLLFLVTIVATAIPARRASRVDPMAALRAE